jgi:transposase-like protein
VRLFSDVARRNGLTPQQVFTWLRKLDRSSNTIKVEIEGSISVRIGRGAEAKTV